MTFSVTAVPIVTLSGLSDRLRQQPDRYRERNLRSAPGGAGERQQWAGGRQRRRAVLGDRTGFAVLEHREYRFQRARASLGSGRRHGGRGDGDSHRGQFHPDFQSDGFAAGAAGTHCSRPSSFYNGADFKAGSISPCSIATIIAPGLAPGIQGVVTPGSLFGPLPYLLASDAVSFNGTAAPIFNVANVSGQRADHSPGSVRSGSVQLRSRGGDRGLRAAGHGECAGVGGQPRHFPDDHVRWRVRARWPSGRMDRL